MTIDKEIIRAVCKDEDFIEVIEYDMQMAIQEINVDWETEKLYFLFKTGVQYEAPVTVIMDYLSQLKDKGH